MIRVRCIRRLLLQVWEAGEDRRGARSEGREVWRKVEWDAERYGAR